MRCAPRDPGASGLRDTQDSPGPGVPKGKVCQPFLSRDFAFSIETFTHETLQSVTAT